MSILTRGPQATVGLSTGAIAVIMTLLLTFVAIKQSQAAPVTVSMAAATALTACAAAWLRQAVLSPLMLPAFLMLVVNVFGYFFGSSFAGSGGASALILLDSPTTRRTAVLLSICVIAFLVGGLITAGRSGQRVQALRRQLRVGDSPRASRARWLLLFMTLLLVAAIAACGPRTLISRPTYQFGTAGSGITLVTSQFGLAAVAALGYIAARNRGLIRVYAYILVIGFGLLYFSLGTRRMAFIPLLFAVGMFAASLTRRALGLVILTAAAAAYLLPLPLYLRGQTSHGLAPYFADMGSYISSAKNYSAIVNNLLVAFPITGDTAYEQVKFPLHYLTTELNPLPGRYTDWYAISPNIRVNPATPDSGIGELGNHGLSYAATFFLLTGAYCGYLHRRVVIELEAGRQVIALAFVAFAALFAVGMLQYNLRSATRSLFYALALDIIVMVAVSIRRHQQT